MTKEKWQDILENINEKFSVEEKGDEHLDDEGGVDIKFVVFTGPLGKVRLEFISKPAILDRKTTYSKRIGSETNIEYVYSETERTEKLNAYKWDDLTQDWVEIEAKNFAL